MPPKSVSRSTPLPGRPQLTVAEQRRLLRIRAQAYALQSIFKYGYRNKEDVSNLPPNVLVVGSQNVLTNASELVGIREGYVLDGPAGTENDYGVDSAYDFENRLGTILNLSKWGATLDVRYLNPVSSVVSWVPLTTALNAANPANFTSFWDQNTELKTFCLFVNGDNKVWEWSGGVGSVASVQAAQTGVITGVSVGAGGGSYAVGDILNVTGGIGGTVRVTAVSGGGAVVSTVALATPGYNYTVSSGNGTTGGSGIGATINITSITTAGSITLSGSYTTSQLGFYDNSADSGKFKLLDQNGNVYTYTLVSGKTFYGITPDPGAAFAVGDPVVQQPTSITGTSIAATGGGNLGTSYTFDLISTLKNQVWYGSEESNQVYVSKTNNYKDVSYTIPARLPAEGALIVLDAAPVALIPEDSAMYASAGTNQWWESLENDQTIDIGGVATPTQTLSMQRIKTAFNQGSQSQALTSKYKNSIIYVSNEPIVNSLGLVKDVYTSPQTVNLSDSIKFDMDAYDFTGGAIDYDNYYIYLTVPANNVVRMYNVQKNYWEAPQILPVSRFYHVANANGQTEIYGHSAYTNEHYQLFTGYNDNGQPINAVAAFPYVSTQGGSADMKKNFNSIYTEGYISANTQLLVNINYDFGGFTNTYATVIDGSDTALIFNKITDGDLGRSSLGTQPLGTILNLPFTPVVPKFRSIKTMPAQDFFEYQIVYSTNQVDAQWTLLRFGPRISGTQSLPTSITE